MARCSLAWPESETISCRRFESDRNSASSSVQISSHWLIVTPMASPPATARSTKPVLTASTSRITTSLRRKE